VLDNTFDHPDEAGCVANPSFGVFGGNKGVKPVRNRLPCLS